ncbi:MAG: zinc-dependent alcohol dehydrogenase [Spirochaetaceae bacterium]
MSGRRRALAFSAPGEAEIIEERLPAPGPKELLVEAICSGVSAGTELLVYRGEAPEGLAVDETIPSLSGGFTYPIRYGYALVGRVAAVGPEGEESLAGRRVFCFHPHASHAVLPQEAVIPLPEQMPAERAVFLPNMETAVNLLLDGAPLIGEQVAVFGLGVVGLLTALLLARQLRGGVVAVEPLEYRRQLARSLAPEVSCLAPGELVPPESGYSGPFLAMHRSYPGFDLVYELSGRPESLDTALGATGFDGRLVLGSWYGRKRASVDLGGRFHRARQRIISSQVSTIRSDLSGRWDSRRRLATALTLLEEFPLERLVTHELALSDAPEAYRRLAHGEPGLMQMVFRY